jgi:hypothetical protein
MRTNKNAKRRDSGAKALNKGQCAEDHFLNNPDGVTNEASLKVRLLFFNPSGTTYSSKAKIFL